MGTKNQPGDFDCYANAEPDEPMFVLLARDYRAPTLVRLWAEVSHYLGTDPRKIEEAMKCAQDMEKWNVEREKRLESDVDHNPEGLSSPYRHGTRQRAARNAFAHVLKGKIKIEIPL